MNFVNCWDHLNMKSALRNNKGDIPKIKLSL